MIIPRNTSDLLAKIQNSKIVKKVTTPVKQGPVQEPINPSLGREAAKLRQRAKAAETELEELKTAYAELTAEIETLRKPAKQWNDYEHIERQKLLATLPAELKADAKTMQLSHLRLFTRQNSTTPETKAKQGEITDKTDIGQLQKSGDAKAINEYVEKVKKGEITPIAPKEVAV
jgi:hypothetical protein